MEYFQLPEYGDDAAIAAAIKRQETVIRQIQLRLDQEQMALSMIKEQCDHNKVKYSAMGDIGYRCDKCDTVFS